MRHIQISSAILERAPDKVFETPGRRMFDQKAIDRIKLIKRLNLSGYPLRAIRELFIEGRKAGGREHE